MRAPSSTIVAARAAAIARMIEDRDGPLDAGPRDDGRRQGLGRQGPPVNLTISDESIDDPALQQGNRQKQEGLDQQP